MKRLHTSNVIGSQTVRRVIQNRDHSQINAVNKINSLSGVSMQPTKIVRCAIPQNTSREQKLCFVCDEYIVGPATNIAESETAYSHEKITKKIARMVGDSFCVIVSEDDVICRRCSTLFNTMDKHEQDLENVRIRLRSLVNKKYGIDEDEPPVKVSRVEQQVRAAPEVIRRAAPAPVQSPSSPAKRGPVKLYKCIACDFKTTDLSQFQPHSNECRGQKSNQIKSTPSPAAPKPQPVNRFQKVGETTITRNISPAANVHNKSVTANQHRVIQQGKVRPYKCKMCLERFETRESAQIHARIHTNQLKANQDKRIQFGNHSNATKAAQQQQQKPLTEIIKEALSEDDQEGEILEFHSCNSCSLTFVNKKLYIQHMKTHENSTEKDSKVSSYGKSQDTLGDLESIFEKMHSDSSHTTSTNGDKNVMVTTQEGGITYNITIPQDEDDKEEKHIDMPSLTGGVEKDHVSMPSLNDEDRSQDEKELQGEEVPMDLEEMAGADGQQLKFIVDENGQFLQLDNHILTTDADGNQILVGVDGNQVLVQLQGGEESMDSEGAAIQMALGDNSQGQGMILIQGPDGESQLIDASMLQQNEDGTLVLQQEDGQTHLISTNGMTFSDGQVQLAVSGEGEDGQQVYVEGMEADESQKETHGEQQEQDETAYEESKEENEIESEEKTEEEQQIEDATNAAEQEQEQAEESAENEQNEAAEQSSADSAVELDSQDASGEVDETKPSADEEIKADEAN